MTKGEMLDRMSSAELSQRMALDRIRLHEAKERERQAKMRRRR